MASPIPNYKFQILKRAILKNANNRPLHGAFGNIVIDRKDREFQLVESESGIWN